MENPKPPGGDVTRLLTAWTGGDSGALEQLIPMIESELHRLAIHHMMGERPGHTLQATALVNEAYIRLTGTKGSWSNRACFFAAASTVMRRILVDHARWRRREKRGGGVVFLSLSDARHPATEDSADVIALDEALDKLSAIDPQKSRIVELRFFGGLSEEEIAGVLPAPLRTVQREWSFARAWLVRQLRTT